MVDSHFISYSSADALDFALRLADALTSGPPAFPAWIDKRHLQAGQDWDVQLRGAIRTCASLIFVMSRDSVEDLSVCKEEWSRALSYKKPVTPILYHSRIEKPFGLGARQHIDFTGDFERGLAQLRTHLRYLASPPGELHLLKQRLADAVRDQRRADEPHELQRIADEMTLLKQQIAAQEHAIAHPEAAAQALQTRIERGLEQERWPEPPVGSEQRTRSINPSPAGTPSYFQDRLVETRLLAEQLHDENKRLLTVVGRGGVGKTAMVCRLLKGIEAGRLPDDLGKHLGELKVDGLIYLSQNGTRRIAAVNLYADLCKLLPADIAQHMEARYRDPQIATDAKTKALLTHFVGRRVIVLLDNLEDLVDPASRQLNDAELNEMLQALLAAPLHGVKVLCTTRMAPQSLALVQPQLQFTLVLDEGLDSPYAENILEAMDSDGKLGLQGAPQALLSRARERTRGFPRALQALVAILSSDRSTTLPELLDDRRAFLPDLVVETLVGEAYSRLDRTGQSVMQALAIYARPVSAAAVDFLLQPYLPAVDAAAALSRLVNMHFVRKEGDRYYLHPVDRTYALERVVDGSPGDGARDDKAGPPPFTRHALWRRGAEYFARAQLPRSAWKRLEDLSAQLAEFDLRCAAQEYSAAADLLAEIDFDYLQLWGHARLLVELRRRLLGKLGYPWQKSGNLGNLGLAYADLGEMRRAMECYEQALAIDREIGDRGGEGAHLGNLGNAYADLGEMCRAMECYEQALVIAWEISDRRNEGVWLGNLGLACAALGEMRRAMECYEQALAIAREIGDRRGEGNHVGNLGLACAALGEMRRAMEWHEQALAIAREIGDRRGEGADLGNLGNAYADLGDTRRAMELYEQALAIAREIGDRRNEGVWLGNLGLVYADLGEMRRAMELYEQALAIAWEIGDRINESLVPAYAGFAHLDHGDGPAALECLSLARTIALEIDNAECCSEAGYGLALARTLAGDLPAARQAIEEAATAPYPSHGPRLAALRGVIALRQADAPTAAVAFLDATQLAQGLLATTPTLVAAQDALALATAGLALIATEEAEARRLAAEAAVAYRTARGITTAPGVVGRAVRLLAALAVADPTGVLAGVTEAAGGKG